MGRNRPQEGEWGHDVPLVGDGPKGHGGGGKLLVLHDVELFYVLTYQLSLCPFQNLNPNQDFRSEDFLLARKGVATITLHSYSIPLRMKRKTRFVLLEGQSIWKI